MPSLPILRDYYENQIRNCMYKCFLDRNVTNIGYYIYFLNIRTNALMEQAF